ncbi:Plasmodium exported protein (PHIST), unknown, putative [Plasmodium sp. gorilla clade G1]|nr:Plasmodium exported protein (PHIST), unknown, putative [Plasmodium sp. gorilla clade G1]
MEGIMRKKINLSKKIIYFFCIIIPIVLILIINIVNVFLHHVTSSKIKKVIYSRHLSEFKKDTFGGLKTRNNTEIKNLNYNDISSQLTKEELYEVLKNMKELPPKNELMNLWYQSINVGKHMTEMLEELKSIIHPYLDKYEIVNKWDDELYPDQTWYWSVYNIGEILFDIETKYTNEFKSLLNQKYTLDNIKNYIYSCIVKFEEIKQELYNKYKKKFQYILEQYKLCC